MIINISQFLDSSKKILFPPSCILCGKYSPEFMCNNCRKRVDKYAELRMYNSKAFMLKYINNDEIYFDKFFNYYKYKGLIRKILLDYKFNNKPYICNFFAQLLLSCPKTYNYFIDYDIIIPVPMQKDKQINRGYNQTELISNIVAKNAPIINGKNIIEKVKNNETQSLLNYNQRRDNVKDAFNLKCKNAILNKKIVLLDDICTTGATVNEIAKILKQNGAKEVLVLVLAKD